MIYSQHGPKYAKQLGLNKSLLTCFSLGKSQIRAYIYTAATDISSSGYDNKSSFSLSVLQLWMYYFLLNHLWYWWLWLLGSVCMHSYLWGEHGQEANGPTFHALHPEQGVTIVLPTKFYVEHTNRKKVHPHEAVCTWKMRGEEIQLLDFLWPDGNFFYLNTRHRILLLTS